MRQPSEAEHQVARARNFLAHARSGWTFLYHTGLLSADRVEPRINSEGNFLGFRPIEPLNMVANMMLAASLAGVVELKQRRLGPCQYEYLARKK